MKQLLSFCIVITTIACKSNSSSYQIVGTMERYDSSINTIISENTKAEIIAEGFGWSEGALWVESHNMLLFSDVPQDTVYKWTEKNGLEIYLAPAGHNADIIPAGEKGSNGLLLDDNGNLVLCQHGGRQMAKMDAPLDKPEAKYITLAAQYNGKKFASPNDAAYNSAGELFFTDPPYGLINTGLDSLLEIPFNGVYKLKKNGEVVLLVDSLTRPNGIAFFPDGRLLVANSDPAKPNWYVYDVKGDSLYNGKIFYGMAGYDKKLRGLPDGFKIDSKGNVFATGPGGVLIFNKEGTLLGRLSLPEPTSNCSLSADEKTLYVTNNMYVLRFKMRN